MRIKMGDVGMTLMSDFEMMLKMSYARTVLRIR